MRRSVAVAVLASTIATAGQLAAAAAQQAGTDGALAGHGSAPAAATPSTPPGAHDPALLEVQLPFPGGQFAPAPPPPLVEVVPRAPARGYLWIGGHWTFIAGRHVWKSGYWTVPPPGQHWVADRWEQDARGHWREHNGFWSR